jgi:hypothetical protein
LTREKLKQIDRELAGRAANTELYKELAGAVDEQVE